MTELRNNFAAFVARPFMGRVIWVLFAVVFFYSGLYFMQAILETEQFAGGWWRWALAGIFPLLLPLFFVVNRRYGCASGRCTQGTCEVPQNKVAKQNKGSIMRMPGA